MSSPQHICYAPGTNLLQFKAGCGKSVLLYEPYQLRKVPHRYAMLAKQSSGNVVDFTMRTFAPQKDTVVIYYFFDYSEKDSLKASAFMRCILHQAIVADKLQPNFQRKLESLFEDRIGSLGPSPDELKRLVYHFIEEYKHAFLIIDGLDEVTVAEQRYIKSWLKEIQRIDSLHICAMTHAAMDMTKVLTRCLPLQIKSDDVEHDIATFVQSQIDLYTESELSDCSPRALELIMHKLVSDADGM